MNLLLTKYKSDIQSFQTSFSSGASIQMWVGSKRNLICLLRTERIYDLLLIFTLSFLCLRVNASFPFMTLKQHLPNTWASKQTRFTPSILRVIVTLLSPRSYSLLFFGRLPQNSEIPTSLPLRKPGPPSA